jgi:type IV pilus assembly protein PilV
MLKPQASRQQGLSLLEAMIALVIISVGLLGIAALQINALKQNNSAYWHSKAVWIAHDMAERMRANNSAIGAYHTIDTANAYAQDCETTACTPANMVIADAAEWKAMVETLPAGRGTISQPTTGKTEITVMWDDEGKGGTNCSNGLTCYTITLDTP